MQAIGPFSKGSSMQITSYEDQKFDVEFNDGYTINNMPKDELKELVRNGAQELGWVVNECKGAPSWGQPNLNGGLMANKYEEQRRQQRHQKELVQPKGIGTMDHLDCSTYCFYCNRETDTKSWDCTVCGLSKGHPVVKAGRCGKQCVF